MPFPRRHVFFVFVFFLLLAPLNAVERERDRGPGPDKERRAGAANPDLPPEDCLQFNCESVPSEISPDNVSQLEEAWRIDLPDIADGAPVHASNVMTDLGERDLL